MLGLMAAAFVGTSVGSASYATHPVLVETESCIRGLASWTPLRNGDSGLFISPGLLAETPWLKQGMILNTALRRKVVMTDASIKGWGALCEGKLTFGLWSEEESGLHINCLEMLAVCQACQLFLPDIRGHHVLVCSDSRSRLGATPHAVERPSCVGPEQFALTEGDACAGQNEPRSRHVVEEQCLFRGMDVPPARGSEICRARVDLFASKDNSHCPIFFTRSMDALAHEWPSLPLYAFPPVALLPQVLRRERELRHKLLLIAPLWRHAPSDSVGVRVIAAPRPIPLRWDLLSQVNGTIWHPRPELWALHVSRREPFGLPERVLNTMAGARADAGRLRGARRMNPQRPCTVPPWDLPTVPMALKGPMFEPLQSLSLRVLSVKTSLQVGDLQALSINPACLEFGPNDSKVVLKPRLGYVPKVL